ncbi:uncharacterized protein At1g66480-like isoform X2 [Prosopis cineraria]|uniref:uncharacterized protein At1g66480-like isoform X2 n=1 Tax=Prosopis cineraria TaxID=364024 RepID=UPI0024100933|nr:uncharacterized protein At1g66480-like isoform X2 [Prosopis cineraria]
MGNTLGGKKTTKVMKIDGETFKLKTPLKAGDVLKDHPGLVLIDSEAVKHYGIRAKPLEPHKDLLPKRLYFLVELPKDKLTVPRRVRSEIKMSAKDRLESLMLSRRSASDLSIIKQSHVNVNDGSEKDVNGGVGVRLKMRLPKSEVEKLVREAKDEAEAAQKIMSLCMEKTSSSSSKEAETSMKRRVSFMPISKGGSEIAVAS